MKHSKLVQEKYEIINQISNDARTILSVVKCIDESEKLSENIVLKECVHSIVDNKCFSACSQLHNEFKIASQLDHPNITRPIDIQQYYKGGCMILFPQANCDGFDLFTKSVPQIDIIKNYLRSMASALAYLHKMDIAHNDFKLENVLCFKNENGEIEFQLSDFGFSYSTQNKQEQNSNRIKEWDFRATQYFSPSIYSQISKKEFTENCEKQGDIFSLGYSFFIVLFQRRLSLKHEFTSDSPIYKNIIKFGKSFIQQKLKTSVQITQEDYDLCLDLLIKMLKKEDSERITALEILEHPFLKN
ncbi:Serine/Threonine kinase domain protein (macronuclear) [Tetrahymena thermophila SB210]|uniref:Serine/Threonine kinase domain protein n=1 Tax=Tetrahymena thermophila (strain SB210) TaxID=312017 RepID=Q239S0_TETTS|nr:Serine/Threonine kinase domain protein [Tetrahymena thermophila SB210]EAR93276.1 Serine/Threonine kinase domain protein [Tetrahymena thermophila SB210]|eukprot:XP_001013521.1 Serine/Threonine kinase domain protein [Tetrahymena thermophila SB210]